MNKDPLDSAIFYLAMKKKSLICALFRYFNVRNFPVQKISPFSRMTPKFAKLYSCEKSCFGWFAKITSHEKQFSDFLSHFLLIISLLYQCFCLGKPNFARFNAQWPNSRNFLDAKIPDIKVINLSVENLMCLNIH